MLGAVGFVLWLFAGGMSANAETPGWAPLGWGMTDEEVRQAVGVAAELHATPGGLKYQMVLSSSVIGVPCTAVLLFDAERRLEKVVLRAENPNAVIYGDLARFLERKLGTFAFHERTQQLPSNSLEHTLWQLPRTRVSLLRSVNADKETISITYAPTDAPGRQ